MAVSEEQPAPEPAPAPADACEKSTALLDAAQAPTDADGAADAAAAAAALDALDQELGEKKLKYPRSVFFIISNEFCERFSYYGMRTILVIYLQSLRYEEDAATVIYHIFTMFCYFFPLIGSIVADSWLGKFGTILYLSIVYAIGNIVISLASAEKVLSIPARPFSILGLCLIAIGTGGIKPCVSAFGGDQFVLPQQEKQMAQFFSLFYFAINSGSLVSTFLTPILRTDVQCLEEESCYPLAFGIPAILMVISIAIFIAGKQMYIIRKPQGNVVLNVCKCIGHALKGKISSKGEKREHWMDYADDTYSKKNIEDIKAALRVLYLYLPLPFFWALFDQQGSRWTFQATRMTGKLGDWSLKPDQMQVVNPLLILIFIPIFESGIYPLLKKCNLLTKPLQRLGVGGVLAALAFIISAIIELQLEPSYAVLPESGSTQIRIFNGLSCDIQAQLSLSSEQLDHTTIKSFDVWTLKDKPVEEYHLKWTGCVGGDGNVMTLNGNATSYLITSDAFKNYTGGEHIEKVKEKALVRAMFITRGNYSLHSSDHTFDLKDAEYNEATPGSYDVMRENEKIAGIELKVGGVYTLLIDTKRAELLVVTPPNDIHMLWLIPQYVVLTMGEVMFSITGLEFSYSQAPSSMKSLMQAGWLLTVAFGNLIVVIIAEAKIWDRQLYEFLLFAGLMLVDMLVFSLMAYGYKYVETPDNREDDDFPLENTEVNGIDNKNFKGDD